MDVKQISKRSRQETVQIELRNHKKEDISVRLIERFHGDWDFVGKTPKIVKKDASKVEFEVDVAANKSILAEYTVIYKR